MVDLGGVRLETSDPALLVLKKILSKGDGKYLSLNFLLWLHDITAGLEEFVEPGEEPLQELSAIASQTTECSPGLRRRFLVSRLARMGCLRYLARNESDELWSPIAEPFKKFALRSDKFTVWEDCTADRNIPRLEAWIKENIDALSQEKKT